MNQKNNQLKKEINFKCSTCQSIYQLLETLKGNNNNCSDNCLNEWQNILADYHHKEMMNYLNKQDDLAEEEEE